MSKPPMRSSLIQINLMAALAQATFALSIKCVGEEDDPKVARDAARAASPSISGRTQGEGTPPNGLTRRRKLP